MSTLYVNTIKPQSGDDVMISGTLDVSGTIKAYKMETITVENSTYQGTTKFGNSTNDVHQFTGSIELTGSTTALTTIGGAVVLNEGGGDAGDLRVESDTKTHMFFVDASTERVGVDCSEPEHTLSVTGTLGVSGQITGSAGAYVAGPVGIGVEPVGSIPLFISGAASAITTQGGAVIFNEGGGDNGDFRVESDAGNALTIDASADTLTINDGNQPFVTEIHGNSAVAITVNVNGVILNEAGHANNDLRVESDNQTHMLFVDSSKDRIGIGCLPESGQTVSLTGTLGVSGLTTLASQLTASSAHFSDTVQLGGTAGNSFGSMALYVSGGANAITVDGGAVVFNESGGDAGDFRVESDTKTHMLFVDASTERIGVDCDEPEHTLSVTGTLGVSGQITGSAGAYVVGPVGIGAEPAGSIPLFVTGGASAITTQGGAVIFNEGGGDAGDFRVESDTEDEALFLDASANTLYVNKGETAFTTAIANTNDVALTVDATGVVLNEDGHATNDFRVESNSNSHMLFVNSGLDRVGINSNTPGHTLSVTGTLGVSGQITGSAGAYVAGPIGVGVEPVGSIPLFVSGGASAITVQGGAVVLNEGGGDAGDFRVESDTEDEALFLDASANTLYVNKGETAFTTIIGSTNDEALRVGAAGVVLNEDAHATNDFRVESDNNTHMLFVNSGLDRVGINSNTPGHTLAVTGTFGVSGQITGSAGAYVTGPVGIGAEPVGSIPLFVSGGASAITTQGGAVVLNEGGGDAGDLRVESDTKTHMFFVDAGLSRIKVGSDSAGPGALLDLRNDYAAGAPALQIINDDVNQVAIKISGSNRTADVIDINANSLAAGNVIDIQADGLDTGGILNLISNATGSAARSLVKIENRHRSANSTTLLHLVQKARQNGDTDDNMMAALAIEMTGSHVMDQAALMLMNSATGSNGAIMVFRKEPEGSVADDDFIGTIRFEGLDDQAGDDVEDVVYSKIDVRSADVSDGAENGNMIFTSMVGGSATEVARTNPESETANTFMGGFGQLRPVRNLSSGNMTLTAAMSGVDIVLSAGSAQTVTLPAKTTKGFYCRILIASSQAHIIQSATGENVINGSIIDFNNTTGGTGLTAVGNQGRITLANAAAGDILEFVSTGALWLVDGKLNDTPTLATT